MKRLLGALALSITLLAGHIEAATKNADDVVKAKKTAAVKKKKAEKDAKAKEKAAEKKAEAKKSKEKSEAASKAKEKKAADKKGKSTNSKASASHATGSADGRAVGQTHDGRTIYEGPRGGHYYYTDSGNKEYVAR